MSDEILRILLLDRSRSILGRKHNIVWGVGDRARDEISLDEAKRILTSDYGGCVATPRELVEKMNGRADLLSGYAAVTEQNWQAYVTEPKIEITCGEAPFIVDMTENILNKRVGFLNAKLQTLNKYCEDENIWQNWAIVAYRSSYGYEIDGRKLLQARRNLLRTYYDYWKGRFPALEVSKNAIREVAEIISWNIFQMDGVTNMVASRRLWAKIKDWSTNEIIDFRDVG